MSITNNEIDKRKKTDSGIPLSIVLEYRETYFGTFKPTETILEICQKALHSSWHERTQPAEWKMCDRDGNQLLMDSRLGDNPIYKQETLFLSKKIRDITDETMLVTAQEIAEKKFFPLGIVNEKKEEKEEKKLVEREKDIEKQN